jgi:hypothetical protein
LRTLVGCREEELDLMAGIRAGAMQVGPLESMSRMMPCFDGSSIITS